MHLLHHRRISREAAGIKALHLAREFLHLFCSLWIVLDHLPETVQRSHTLLICALGVGGIAGSVLRLRMTRLAVAIVACIDIAPDSPVGAASVAVADIAAAVAKIGARLA